MKPDGNFAENNNFSFPATSSTAESNLFGGTSSSTHIPSENLFLATSQVPRQLESIRSNNIRSFLRTEELKGRLTAVASTSTDNSNRINFNFQQEYSKYRLNTRNKSKRKLLSQFLLILP
jgi:hypothetical protein